MPNIRHKLLIASSQEKVYDAITSQQGLSAWWTPNTNAVPEVNSISRFTFGSGYFKEMKVVELKPLIKWVCIAGAGEWIGTTISFELQGGDKETLLSSNPEMGGQAEQQDGNDQCAILNFRHDGWKDHTPMFAECNYTWGQFLKSLKLYCETGEGRPYPNQHK